MTVFFFSLLVLWLRLPCQPGTHPKDLLVCRVQSGDVSPRGSGPAGGSSRRHGHPRGQAQIYGHAQSDLLPSGVLWLSATHGRRGESPQTRFSLCRERLALLCLLCVWGPLVRFFVFPNYRCVSSVHSNLSRQSCWCAITSSSPAWPRWRLKTKRWERILS